MGNYVDITGSDLVLKSLTAWLVTLISVNFVKYDQRIRLASKTILRQIFDDRGKNSRFNWVGRKSKHGVGRKDELGRQDRIRDGNRHGERTGKRVFTKERTQEAKVSAIFPR